MSTLARALFIAVLLPIAAAAQAPQNPPQNPEAKKIPEDSVEIATTGQWEGTELGLLGGPRAGANHAKIGVSSRAAATLFAMEHGLVAWGELPIGRIAERS
jgi:hypothetical protein